MSNIIREFKGKNTIILPRDFCVVDIETTGLVPEYDSILQISSLKIRNMEIVDTFKSNVYYPKEVDDFITQISKITTSMVKSAPTIDNVISDFFNFIQDDLLLGLNTNFSINFIYDASSQYLNNPLKNNFIDISRFSRKLFPELRHHRLCDMIERFELDESGEYSSFCDCECIFNSYAHILTLISDEDSFIKSFIKKPAEKLDANMINLEYSDTDIDAPFYNTSFVFTGVLESMGRKDAMIKVASLGGQNLNTVTKETNFLVLGNNDYCSSIKDGKSAKQKKAEKYILKGVDLKIISENVFLDMIEDALC